MARSIIRKSNARLKFLYRKSKFLTLHTKKLLVTSLIQCHFDYASSAWYNSLTQDLKNKLQVTQNKLMRFVLNLQPRSHIGKEHFSRLQWLPVVGRMNQITLCHVYKINSKLSPFYLREQFTPINEVHKYPTRFRVKVDGTNNLMSECKRFAIPKVKGFGGKSFAFNGCNLWNSLPQDVRDAKSISSFKSKVKEHLLSSV